MVIQRHARYSSFACIGLMELVPVDGGQGINVDLPEFTHVGPPRWLLRRAVEQAGGKLGAVWQQMGGFVGDE